MLVGGQAVNFWGERYVHRSPELAQAGPFTSKDVDFCGSAHQAREVARALGGTCKVPALNDLTPCTALVQYEDGAFRRQIDFLGAPYGLQADDVRASSILFRVQTSHGEVRFRVMHPLHCLESRTKNVYDLPGYDNERGLRQLRASIVCVREFARELLDQVKTRGALRLNERVFAFAQGEAALGVWVRHGVSVFGALSTDARLPARFLETRHPQMLAAIQRARSRAAERHSRQRK